ncbi:hypothetical protein B0T14DRAFT_508095 [Immersiella caudata]|uniref:Uncharacterized protein n=1 Tax=Immersiella caudata TaxID=314043 RepID=A0AA39XH86_9PEZI|nr:hypothetical protein B0T14DRAFT_508095 [Immersiella caudata]
MLTAETEYEHEHRKKLAAPGEDVLDPDSFLEYFYSKGLDSRCKSEFRVVFEQIMVGTNGPYCGMGPLETMEGDIVCIFFGCPFPIVIRPSPLYDGEYAFLGPAYLCGAMEGQVVSDANMKEKKLKVETFILC